MSIFVAYTAIVGIAFIIISLIEMSAGVNIFSGMPIKW